VGTNVGPDGTLPIHGTRVPWQTDSNASGRRFQPSNHTRLVGGAARRRGRSKVRNSTRCVLIAVACACRSGAWVGAAGRLQPTLPVAQRPSLAQSTAARQLPLSALHQRALPAQPFDMIDAAATLAPVAPCLHPSYPARLGIVCSPPLPPTIASTTPSLSPTHLTPRPRTAWPRWRLP